MSKSGLSGSLQNKNGKLYAVIGYNDVVTQKRKMKWISLGLDENDKKSVINRALRDAISDFEDEYDKMLSGLRSPEDYPFLAFLTEWLETVKIKKVQESTINGYRQIHSSAPRRKPRTALSGFRTTLLLPDRQSILKRNA